MARPWIDLEKIGIRREDVLTHVDRPSETCEVVELYPPKVLFRGQVLSLTAAASKAYESEPEIGTPAAMWKYEGETLQERRDRFEKWHRPRGKD